MQTGKGSRNTGSVAAQPGGLWSVTQESVYPVDEKTWDIEVTESFNRLLLDYIKNRVEINEDKAGRVIWDVKVL